MNAEANATEWVKTIWRFTNHEYAKKTLKMVIYAKKNNKKYATNMTIDGEECSGHIVGGDIMKASLEHLEKLLEDLNKHSI